jgi:hypothetical protein
MGGTGRDRLVTAAASNSDAIPRLAFLALIGPAGFSVKSQGMIRTPMR